MVTLLFLKCSTALAALWRIKFRSKPYLPRDHSVQAGENLLTPEKSRISLRILCSLKLTRDLSRPQAYQGWRQGQQRCEGREERRTSIIPRTAFSAILTAFRSTQRKSAKYDSRQLSIAPRPSNSPDHPNTHANRSLMSPASTTTR